MSQCPIFCPPWRENIKIYSGGHSAKMVAGPSPSFIKPMSHLYFVDKLGGGGTTMKTHLFSLMSSLENIVLLKVRLCQISI